ncbi:carbohydrate kinase family protein [Humidisolicoccus flavus]|uniref:carbohydrate kinase family protein n=1 Tax=Humidisolicoccus flavus TaxID=3111414 RepID=UPI00324BB6FD
MSPSVVVIGDVLVDVVDGLALPGGAGFNVAIGLAKLGNDVTLIGMVGDDDYGRQLEEACKGAVTLVKTPAPNGSAAAIASRVDGTMQYEFNSAAKARSIVIEADAQHAIDNADLVVVSCVALEDGEQCDALLSAVPDSRARLVIDANPRPGYLDDASDVRAFGDNLRRIAPHAALLKLGDEDSQLLYERDVNETARQFLDAGAGGVLVTRGEHGASLEFRGLTKVSAPIHELDSPIVDTIGAGDATLAAIVDSMLEQRPIWGSALERAMTIAALTCRVAGGDLQVPNDELDSPAS